MKTPKYVLLHKHTFSVFRCLRQKPKKYRKQDFYVSWSDQEKYRESKARMNFERDAKKILGFEHFLWKVRHDKRNLTV